MTATDAPFGATTARTVVRRRDAELARRLSIVSRRAQVLVGEVDAGDDDPLDVVAGLADACAERLRSQPPPPADAAAICALASELQRLALDLHDHEMAGRTRRLAAGEHALSRLRALPSSAELIDRVCEEVNRSCGFGRTLISRVVDGQWRPWVLHEVDPTVDWFEAWRDASIPLDELTLETQLLTECRPALVDDLTVPGVHPMVHTGHSNSYVVAPVMPAGRIIGFLHSDHHPTERRCDAVDREVLWAFAEGFGHLYERTVLLERLRSQREQVRATLATVDETMEQLTESEIELALQTESSSPVSRTAFSVLRAMTGRLDELTPREQEVLELIVAGARNQEIAGQLAITEATVKSHVKHILSKLGAVNRAQAIAYYLGVDADRAD